MTPIIVLGGCFACRRGNGHTRMQVAVSWLRLIAQVALCAVAPNCHEAVVVDGLRVMVVRSFDVERAFVRASTFSSAGSEG